MRDGGADRRNLANHVLLVGLVDRKHISFDAIRVDHGHGGRQANLKPDVARQVSALSRRAKVFIGGTRFPRVTKLAEIELLRLHPVREAENRKARDPVYCPAWVGNQKWTGAQQRILPANPQPSSADLAVG